MTQTSPNPAETSPSPFADSVVAYAQAPTPEQFLAGDPVALYRHLDARGELLYVGITGDLVRRWEQHLESSAWSVWVASSHVCWFPDRAAARRAEVAAIASEAPIFNTHRRHRRAARKIRERYLATGSSGLPRRVPCRAVAGEFCISCGPDAEAWLDGAFERLSKGAA